MPEPIFTDERTSRMRQAVDAAIPFLEANDYPLGVAWVRHRWVGLPASEVIDQLARYQQPDGGFAGLEVDIKAPVSNAFAGRLAMHKQAAALDVNYPILRNSRLGVERGHPFPRNEASDIHHGGEIEPFHELLDLRQRERLGRFLRKSGRTISIPIFRDIKENIAFSMIFLQTGTLLKSGMPLVLALKLTEPLDPVKGRLRTVQEHIKKGYRFSQGLEKEGSFPEEIVSVVRVGESGRDLPDSLIRLGNNCWDIAQSSMQKYAELAEPIIILVMGFLVGFVVIAVLLPIFDLSTLATG